MTSRRQERVAEVLTEELALLISSELIDPRLEDAMVTVTAVEVSPDLGNARVFIQHALPANQTRHVLSALQHSSTFLRRSLVENLHLRVVPELHFAVDDTEKRAHRIDEILELIAAESRTDEGTPGYGNSPAADSAEAEQPGSEDGQGTSTEQGSHADAEERSAN